MAATPGPLRLIQEFVNTIDVETGDDEFGHGDSAAARESMRAWLMEHGLLTDGESVDGAGYERVRAVRDLLRRMLLANHDHVSDRGAEADLHRLAAGAPLVVGFEAPGRTSLRPVAGGVEGVLGRLLAQVHEAMGNGTWPRLKLCREGTCQWAFYDTSRNRSGTWCSMKVCGNRTKVRKYQARRREHAQEQAGE